MIPKAFVLEDRLYRLVRKKFVRPWTPAPPAETLHWCDGAAWMTFDDEPKKYIMFVYNRDIWFIGSYDNPANFSHTFPWFVYLFCPRVLYEQVV